MSGELVPMTQEEVLHTLMMMDRLNANLVTLSFIHRDCNSGDFWDTEDTGGISEWNFEPDEGKDRIELAWTVGSYEPEFCTSTFPVSLLWSDIEAAKRTKAAIERSAKIRTLDDKITSANEALSKSKAVQDDAQRLADVAVSTNEATVASLEAQRDGLKAGV